MNQDKDLHLTHPHDFLFKKLFERKEVFLDFLSSRLPEHLFQKLDTQSLELTNKSFTGPVGQQGESDLVFKANIQNKPGYIYTIIEHQSTSSPDMPLRFLEYNIQLLRQHWTQEQGAKKEA